MINQISFRLKENTIALYTIIRREALRFFRIWTQTLLPPVISMTLYFIIFGNWIGRQIQHIQGFQYIDYLIPGLIIMPIITNAYGNVVASFFSSKFQRNLEEMLVSPMPNAIILWGFVIGGVLRGLAVGVLVTFVSLFFSSVALYNILVILMVVILSSILFSLAGLINGIFAKKFDDINIIPVFVLTPLTYLGGVFYSVDMLPPFWKAISYCNPIFYMVSAFRYGMLGISEVAIGLSLALIIGFCVILYIISMWLLHRGIGIKS